MADERVNIVIDVDTKNTAAIAATSAALASLNKQQNNNSRSAALFSKQTNQSSSALVGATSSAAKFNKAVGSGSAVMKIFTRLARIMLFTVIAMGVEFAIVAVSLASINLLFATGRFLVKSYGVAMQALAGTFNAVGAAALGAAAAFREVTAAQFAFRFKGSPNVKAGMADATGALQNLYQDSTLATAGVMNLNAAFAAVAKNSAFTPQTQAGLRMMMDFAVASGDTAKGLQAAGNFLGLIQKEGKATQKVLDAAKQVGPEFEKAFKAYQGKGKMSTAADFFKVLRSGDLSKEGGVAGAADAVQKTLFAQLKMYMTKLYGEMAGIGQELLEPLKKTFSSVFQILRTTLRRISSDMLAFGGSTLTGSIVTATQKIADFAVHLNRKWLPEVEGFFGRISSVYNKMSGYTRRFLDVISPLREGGRVIIDMFGKPFSEILKGFGRNIKNLADLATSKKELFSSFGDAMKNVVAAFFEMSDGFKRAFTEAIPIINKVVNAIATIMRALGGVFKLMSGMGPLGAFMPVAGTIALGMKGRRNRMRYGSRFGSGGAGGSLSSMFGGGGVAGPMAAAGAASMANQAAGGGSLIGAASGLTGAASALTGAAAALTNSAAGSALRGGMGGGYVDRATGMAIRPPNRKPGQSNADYRRDVYGWRMANRGSDLRPIYGRGFNKNTASSGGPNIYGRATSTVDPYSSLRGLNKQQYREFDRMQRATRSGGSSYNYDALAASQMSRSQQIQSGLRASGSKGVIGSIRGMKASAVNAFIPQAPFIPGMKQYGKAAYQGSKNAARKAMTSSGGFISKSLSGTSLQKSYQASMRAQSRAGFKPSRMRAGGMAMKKGLGAGSMVASMAASYAASKLGTDEAQGALQGGAAVGAFSPLAGIAVGGIGTSNSAQTTKGGVLSGAIGGAAAGALIGSFIPIIGTGVGALIGGAIGAVNGWFQSDKNKKKMRKEAVASIEASSLIPVIGELFSNGMKGTAVGAATKEEGRLRALATSGSDKDIQAEFDRLQESGMIDATARARAFESPTAARGMLAESAKGAAVTTRMTKFVSGRYQQTMIGLMASTGMTEEAISKLAGKMGVNLYDPTLKLTDAMSGLGVGIRKTAEEIQYAIKDHLIKGLEVLENFVSEADKIKALNNAQNRFNADPTQDSFNAVVSGIVTRVTDKSATQMDAFNTIKNIFTPGSKDYIFAPGAPLAEGFKGLGSEAGNVTGRVGSEYLTSVATGVSQTSGQQISSMLAEQNLVLGGAGQGLQLEKKIKNMLLTGTDQERLDLQTFLSYGSFAGLTGQGQSAEKIADLLGLKDGNGTSLSDVGGGGARTDFIKNFQIQLESKNKVSFDDVSQKRLEDIVSTLETGLKQPEWWNSDAPEWWSRGFVLIEEDGKWKLGPGDTSTRRSRSGDTSTRRRLGSTLSAHGRFDSALTGKRSITSALRTNNLGSINSDHATGDAYDLVGQNLGQYARMVNRSGGFAEFHGVNANRHLHVVPNAGRPASGDTTSARRSKTTTDVAYSRPNVNVNVYASPNMNTDELVNKIMKAQEKAMRNSSERM